MHLQTSPVREHGSALNRRASARIACRVPVLVTEPESFSEPMDGLVLDKSAGGVRLVMGQQIPAGTILNIRSRKACFVPWIQVEVMYCFRESGRWALGCQFVRTPARGVLSSPSMQAVPGPYRLPTQAR